jgi:hypothetical protein
MSLTEQIQLELAALPLAQQQRVLDFIHALQRKQTDDDGAVGEASVQLAIEVLEPEDFSTWEKAR